MRRAEARRPSGLATVTISGSDSKFLIRKIAAGAPQSGLNFVGDQRGIVLRRKCAGALPECLADRENPAFALNRFDHNGADRGVKFRFEVGDIVEAHEFDAGNQRRKRLAIFRRMRDRKRAKSAAVKGILERQNARFRRPAVARRFCVRVCPRKLQRAFDRFRAAVREKHAIESRPFGQLARERRLIRIVEQIRNMSGAARFAPDHSDDSRMRVAERIDRDAAEKIEIFASLANRRGGSRARA